MNQQEELAAFTASKTSRRFKVGCTGAGWPKPNVPYLRMRGRWLERAGFVIGRNVKVEISEGRLLIEVIDDVTQ